MIDRAAQQIDPGQMRFLDNYVPPLPAGRYRIDVTQTLRAETAGDPDAVNVAQTARQEFAVSGPRFSIPAQEIHHLFPPANAQGVFQNALPQIVMTHRALPWERTIWDGAPQVPWLALVVLDRDQIMPPTVGTAAGQAPNASATGVTTIPLSALTTPEAGVLLPDLVPDPADNPSQQIEVVDLSVDGFNIAVPRQDILALLASVREVNIGDKTAGGMLDAAALPADADLPAWSRWFSVVTANRFPDAPATLSDAKTQSVHLLSLEGFTDYLRSDNPLPLPAGTTRIRMVSLAHWSFATLPTTGQSFADLMAGLAPAPGESLSLTLTHQPAPANVPQDTADYAASALAAGYVPRSYRTWQGERTFAWYRGPFVAKIPAPLPKLASAPVNSAELAVYDPDRGVFDLSYATAFETGRLMALSSGAFSAALLRWQSRGLRLLSLVAERAAEGGLDLARLDAAAVEGLARAVPAQRRVVNDLSEGGLDLLHRTFLAPRVQAPPSNEAASAGLSLEHATLRDALDSAGVRAWLATRSDGTLDEISGFLSRLWLLDGVPFNALVPDSRLLPVESFRAFYVDRNWQLALVQGALAIGVVGSREAAFQQALRGELLDRIETMARDRRNALLGMAGLDGEEASLQMTGFLMRSAAVSGWPGLQVKAFRGLAKAGGNVDQRKGRLPIRRLTRLASDVMLGLFGGLADWIEVDEPREGLHFGVESGNKVFLRNLSGPDTGVTLASGAFVSAEIDANRVLNLPKLVSDLQQALSSGPLGPADLALEMITVPESMVFRSVVAANGVA